MCEGKYHINCLPFISKNDSIYMERNLSQWICTMCSQDIFPFNHCDDDDDFIESLSGLWNIKPTNSFSKASDKLFLPFELNTSTNSPLYDVDPDLNLYCNFHNTYLPPCDYYSEDTFNSLCKNNAIVDSQLSLIHSNIRSIPSNLNSFISYLENLSITFTIMAFTETWLKEYNNEVHGVLGYNAVHHCRPQKKGGGVALYVKEGISFTIRRDLFVMTDHMESAFIEIDNEQLGLRNNAVIGVIYRPPNTDILSFNDSLSEIMSLIKAENKSCYVLGDYNINLLNTDAHSHTREFVDTMYSHSLLPNITKPTREASATLIDNIFSNDIFAKHDTVSGILDTDITDHFPIFHVIFSSSVKPDDYHRAVRAINDDTINKFISMVTDHDWGPILSSTDAQEAYTKFHEIITIMYNKCFPFRKNKSFYKCRKPWLSDALKKSIKEKNRLFRLSREKPSQTLENKYKEYRNRLNTLLRVAEKEHFAKLLEDNKSNLKNSRKILKEVINTKKNSNSASKFLIDGNYVTDKNVIANGFNSFFVNIGPNLAKKIPESTDACTKFIKSNRITDTLLWNSTNETELISIIKTLKNGSSGWDNISTKVIKASSSQLIKPLAHIFNLSLTSGVFPLELKIARVIPIFKSGDPSNLSNYRPVSVLPVFSKILERLVYTRILTHINERNLLYKYQFGFRNEHSPNLAIIYLVDKISNALQNGDFVLGLYLDFSKAFDTVNHDILLKKLEYYGIRGVAYNWLQSYLSARTQYVEYNQSKSLSKCIKCGVPQGSLLGPLLFLLYINDLANVSEKLFSLFFADDSNLFIAGRNPNELISELNTEIKLVTEWLTINKLSLNVDKTHYMLFRTKRRACNVNGDVKIGDKIISRVEKTKFLGVFMDSTLSWQYHIQYIEGKIARTLGILCKARKVFTSSTLKTLYYTFLYPYLNYCIEAWGNTYTYHINALTKLQNRAVRIITGSPKRTHLLPLYEDLRLLEFRKIYSYAVQLFMYKRYHNKLPYIFQPLFQVNYDVSGRITRQGNLLHMPFGSIGLRRRTLVFSAVSLHNFFCNILDYNCSIVTYKYRLKEYLLSKNRLPEIQN